MYFSMTFAEPLTEGTNVSVVTKNTWDDWFLIPTSRPVINPPPTKTQYVDLTGSNGQLDLTDSLSGFPVYGVSTGSWEFLVDNDHRPWLDIYNEVKAFLHGKRKVMYWEEDPAYEYEGRFSVNEWKSEQHNSKITIDYTIDPYPRRRWNAADDWLWDPFNFDTGIILKDALRVWQVNSADEWATRFDTTWFASRDKSLELLGNMPVKAKVYVIPETGSTLSIRFTNIELDISAVKEFTESTQGLVEIPEFLITNRTGENLIRVEARGVGEIVRFDYEVGRL